MNKELKEEMSRMNDEFIAVKEEMESKVWESATLEERMTSMTHVVGGEASKLILLAGVLIEDAALVAQGLEVCQSSAWRCAVSQRASEARARAAEEGLEAARDALAECQRGLEECSRRRRRLEEDFSIMQVSPGLARNIADPDKERLADRTRVLESYLMSVSRNRDAALAATSPWNDKGAWESMRDDLSGSYNQASPPHGDDAHHPGGGSLQAGRDAVASFVGRAIELEASEDGLRSKVEALTRQLSKLSDMERAVAAADEESSMVGAGPSTELVRDGGGGGGGGDGKERERGVSWLAMVLKNTQEALAAEQARCVSLESQVGVLMGEKGMLEVQLSVANQLVSAHAQQEGAMSASKGAASSQAAATASSPTTMATSMQFLQFQSAAFLTPASNQRQRGASEVDVILAGRLKTVERERDEAEGEKERLVEKLGEAEGIIRELEGKGGKIAELEERLERVKVEKEELAYSLVVARREVAALSSSSNDRGGAGIVSGGGGGGGGGMRIGGHRGVIDSLSLSQSDISAVRGTPDSKGRHQQQQQRQDAQQQQNFDSFNIVGVSSVADESTLADREGGSNAASRAREIRHQVTKCRRFYGLGFRV